AKLSQEPSADATVAYRYQPPQVSPAKVPLAGPDFAANLVKLKDKELGETTVQADQSEGTYYMAIIVDKYDPKFEDFMKVYKDAASDSVRRDPLLQMFENKRTEEYRKDAIEMLRKQANRTIVKEHMQQYEGSLGSESD